MQSIWRVVGKSGIRWVQSRHLIDYFAATIRHRNTVRSRFNDLYSDCLNQRRQELFKNAQNGHEKPRSEPKVPIYFDFYFRRCSLGRTISLDPLASL